MKPAPDLCNVNRTIEMVTFEQKTSCASSNVTIMLHIIDAELRLLEHYN